MLLLLIQKQLLRFVLLLLFRQWQTVFGGDICASSYWSFAINVNAGGFANGIGGGNNTQSYVPGYAAFPVNMRTSGSSTSFDRNLLTFMPFGECRLGVL